MALTVGTNSYVTVAEADEYFANRPFSLAWTGEDGQKADALAAACRHLHLTYEWRGEATDPNQRLAWPRKYVSNRNGADIPQTEVPEDIKSAQMELAYMWIQADQLTAPAERYTASDPTGLKGAIKKEKLGDLEREYHEPTQQMFGVGGVGMVTKKYPIVDLLVKPFIVSSTGAVFKRIVQ